MWKPAFLRALYPSYQNFFSCDGAKPRNLSLLFAVVGSPWRLASRELALGSLFESKVFISEMMCLVWVCFLELELTSGNHRLAKLGKTKHVA